MRRRKLGSRLACSARKFKKSHRGMNAMNLRRVGRCEKSATMISSPPTRLELARSVVGELQEFIQQPELMEELERRWMNGAVAKVAEEVAVLLEHRDVDSCSR